MIAAAARLEQIFCLGGLLFLTFWSNFWKSSKNELEIFGLWAFSSNKYQARGLLGYLKFQTELYLHISDNMSYAWAFSFELSQ